MHVAQLRVLDADDLDLEFIRQAAVAEGAHEHQQNPHPGKTDGDRGWTSIPACNHGGFVSKPE
jgi:hypothetical protein